MAKPAMGSGKTPQGGKCLMPLSRIARCLRPVTKAVKGGQRLGKELRLGVGLD